MSDGRTPVSTGTHEHVLLGLQIEAAVEAHKAWCEKLEATLKGENPEQYDPALVGADHLCVMGKWLYSQEQHLQQYEEYQKLREIHARFHQCAAKIILDHKNNRFMDAIFLLRHELVQLSQDVQQGLMDLQLRIKLESFRRP